MRLSNIGNILLKIFAGIFAVISGYLMCINIFSNYGRLLPMNRVIVLVGAIAIISVLFLLKMLFNKLKDKTLVKISIIFGIILVVLQIVFVIYCRVKPSWDFGVIFYNAYNISNSVFDLPEYYYKFYPNNLGALLLFTAIFKIVSIFTVKEGVYLLVGCIFNIIMIDGAVVIMYVLIKNVFNLRMATLFSVLCILIVPMFTYSPIFYTDTITMIFPAAMLLLLYNFNNSRSNMRIFYLVAIGVVGAMGIVLKTNIVIPLVAVFIYVICTNKIVKGIVNNLIILAAFLLIFSGYKAVANYVMPIDYSEAGLPMTHWVMMGLKNSGAYNEEDVNFSASFESKKEAQKANIQEIKNRLREYGAKGYLEFLTRKIKFTWNDGTYYSVNKLSREPLENNIIEEHVVGEKNHPFIYFSQMSHLALITLIFISSLAAFKKKNSYRFMQCTQIAIFGVFLFLIIWETRSRYLVCILPLMMFSAIGGLDYLGEGRN